MKPFAYQAPTTVAEAVALLADQKQRARVLAGGTDLLVQLRRGLFELDLMVDVKRIPDLTQIAFDPVHGLTIGAAVSCAVCCESPAVREHYPGLLDAASIIGGAAIQGRATLGGNLCNAAPSADIIPPLIVLDAHAIVAGPADTRTTVPVAAFCTAPGQTVLAQGEMLVAIRIPPPAPHTGAAYVRFTPRREMDIACLARREADQRGGLCRGGTKGPGRCSPHHRRARHPIPASSSGGRLSQTRAAHRRCPRPYVTLFFSL